MLEIIKLLENKLSTLDLTNDDKEQLADLIKKLNKSATKTEYKVSSNQNREKSTVNLMNLMIEELDEKKKIIEEINEQLKEQKEEVISQRDEIASQRDAILGQKELIDRQNHALTDSIQYARRIQDALLPAREVMRYLLPQHFVFFRPRDIVSGDFFWVDKRNDTVFLVVADSTGHGVPGAFMSMLGISLLNEMAGKFKDIPTDEIMGELRDKLIAVLRQTGEMDEAKDGIEMGLAAIHTASRQVRFTGACQDLYMFQKGELVIAKGDRMPVGLHSEGVNPFTASTHQLHRGDTLYLLTDGYPDQFGGPKRKKFGSLRLKALLAELQTSIMHDQKATVEEVFNTWKGENEQIDDVLMIGIQL